MNTPDQKPEEDNQTPNLLPPDQYSMIYAKAMGALAAGSAQEADEIFIQNGLTNITFVGDGR